MHVTRSSNVAPVCTNYQHNNSNDGISRMKESYKCEGNNGNSSIFETYHEFYNNNRLLVNLPYAK